MASTFAQDVSEESRIMIVLQIVLVRIRSVNTFISQRASKRCNFGEDTQRAGIIEQSSYSS